MEKNLQIALKACILAGEAIMEIYQNPEGNWEIEEKSDHSPLTKADKISHKIIADSLVETGLPLLSEEGEKIPYEERSKWSRFWLVDPLDGTKEFLKKNGEFTVNIALIENQKPILGTIYIPVTRVLYWGVVGEGAYRAEGVDGESSISEIEKRGVKLPLSSNRTTFTIVASRSHLNGETAAYIDQLRRMYPEVALRSAGSSLKISLVAEGAADIYPRFAPTMEWDTAAGHAIAKAAGREIYRRDEKSPLIYNKENLENPWFIVK